MQTKKLIIYDKVSNSEEVWYNEQFVKEHGQLEFNRGLLSVKEENKKITYDDIIKFMNEDLSIMQKVMEYIHKHLGNTSK